MVATPHAINVTLYEKSPISITRDIVPVASINSDAFVLLVNPSFPAKTVAEFIAYAKANPGKINLASNGTGNLTHLSGELFRMMTGIEVVHVPYRGTPATHSALIAGPRCRRCRASRVRKPIRRGPCASLLDLPPLVAPTSWHA
jgi:tripartite-type tricarboxylate transporter receptor subunit TctC